MLNAATVTGGQTPAMVTAAISTANPTASIVSAALVTGNWMVAAMKSMTSMTILTVPPANQEDATKSHHAHQKYINANVFPTFFQDLPQNLVPDLLSLPRI